MSDITTSHSTTAVCVISEKKIESILSSPGVIQENPQRIQEILLKAKELKGLSTDDVASLLAIESEPMLTELFETARYAKNKIYGSRLVIFAPLYVSNLCANECTYCAFRAKNKEIVRRSLSQKEIAAETKQLIEQGQKRILLVAGEAYPKQGLSYILEAIDTIYATKSGKSGEIRRINVNIAPLSVEEFKQLHDKRIGTYQIFQETYHRQTYESVHVGGMKKNYDWRITAIDRAMEAGIDDVGVGVLFGLYDWKFELLALMEHAKYLEEKFGVGPHTISVPRLEPASGSSIASMPPHAVSDRDFKKIIAILRLAVPYTGLILSTRENPRIRSECLALGVSQISAGSRTDPGGYAEGESELHNHSRPDGQFSLGDHRTLEEVIYDIVTAGYMPSFCTGCYRMGRTGHDFMDLAKPGEIKNHCDPNGISTFAEYLLDYATPQTREAGMALIKKTMQTMEGLALKRASSLLAMVEAGKRDVYC